MTKSDSDWADWWRRHSPALLMFARTWTDTLRDAEDALHDGFISFYRNRASAQDALAYMYTCIKRAALINVAELCGGEIANNRSRSKRRNAWFEPIADNERREQIEQALQTLPNEQRQAVILKIWGQLTFPQIGEVLSLSPNTVASRYRYALDKLSQTLSAELLQ